MQDPDGEIQKRVKWRMVKGGERSLGGIHHFKALILIGVKPIW